MTQSFTYSNFKIFLDNSTKVENPDIIKKSNARYIYKLKTPIILPPHDAHMIQIGVESLSLPLTFTAINETNDTIYLNGENLTLIHGNYNVTTFLAELNSKFALSSDYTDVSATYNSITSKIVLTSDNGRATIQFVNTEEVNSAEHLIGSVEGTHNMPYAGENGINLTYTTGITVRINNLSTINQDLSKTGSGSTSLIRVPINTSPNTVLSLLTDSPFMATISDKVITELDLGLYDDNQNELLIKNNPFFIVLRVNFIKNEKYILDRTALQIRMERPPVEHDEKQLEADSKNTNPLGKKKAA